jgi:hypothetical protein
MSDITAGPDCFVRFLASNHDEENAEVGDEPKSYAEIASDRFVAARIEARKRTLGGKPRPVKVTYTLTITETISPGNGDLARASEPDFDFVVKMSKAPPIKGRASNIDAEGNQIGRVAKQMGIKGIDGGKAERPAKAERKVSAG